MKFDRSSKFDLLWAIKFATAKIECIARNGQVNTFGGNIYFAGDGT